MDDELRNAFATLSSQMSDIGTDARQAASQAKEAAHATTMLGVRIQGLESDVGQLKTAVFGSNPPPAPVPIAKRITHNEGDLAEITGRVMALEGQVGDVKEINEAQSKELARVSGMVGDVHAAVVGVVTNKKVMFVGKVIFAIAVGYSGLHGLKVLP